MTRIVTVAEMRALEDRAAGFGLPGPVLLEQAGRAVAAALQARWPEPAPVLCLIGPGNNGGDGLVAARELALAGYRVSAYVWSRRRDPDGELNGARAAGVEVQNAAADPDGALLQNDLAVTDRIVDALLGIGHSRPISGALERVLNTIRAARRSAHDIVAVDVPSGLNADTGQVDPATLPAGLTLTLGAAKWGLLRPPGDAVAGRVEVLDIGIPAHLEDPDWPRLLTECEVATALPARPTSGHKGTFGRVLIIAGSTNYYGAASLAAEAAYRAGAGLVTLAVPASLVPIFAAKVTEPTFLPLPEAAPGILGRESVSAIRSVLPDCDAALVGPGLGRAETVRALLVDLLPVLSDWNRPTVIDADGLNALAEIDGWWRHLRSPAIFTPHPAEFGRLTGRPVAGIQSRRESAAREAAARWRQTVVLKGAYSVIAEPPGPVAVSPFAVPLLATAGTGDVLSGLIAGLLAQGVSTGAAATAGVWLHAAAASQLVPEYGQAGLLASELLPLIPRARRLLSEKFPSRP